MQVACYTNAIKEMLTDQDGVKLLKQFPVLWRLLNNSSVHHAGLVYFVDGKEDAQEFNFSYKAQDERYNLGAYFYQFLDRLDQFWQVKPDSKGKRHNPNREEAKKMLEAYKKSKK